MRIFVLALTLTVSSTALVAVAGADAKSKAKDAKAKDKPKDQRMDGVVTYKVPGVDAASLDAAEACKAEVALLAKSGNKKTFESVKEGTSSTSMTCLLKESDGSPFEQANLITKVLQCPATTSARSTDNSGEFSKIRCHCDDKAGCPVKEVVKRSGWVTLLLATWVVLLVDLLWLAPSRLPSSLDLFVRALVFDRRTFDPSLIGLFYATGIVVTLHASLVWAEDYESSPHPIALLLLGYAFGSLFFLPYYAWRRAGQRRSDARPWPASPFIRWVLALELLGACGYAIVAGRAANLWTEVSERWFSHFLLLDFLTLGLLLLALAAGRLAPRLSDPA